MFLPARHLFPHHKVVSDRVAVFACRDKLKKFARLKRRPFWSTLWTIRIKKAASRYSMSDHFDRDVITNIITKINVLILVVIFNKNSFLSYTYIYQYLRFFRQNYLETTKIFH